MNHTVVVTEEWQPQKFDDRANIEKRHCRIGKVTFKVRYFRDKLAHPVRVWPTHPFEFAPFPEIPGVFSLPPMHEACRGCIGKACGNAACPSRPVVTCGPSPASFSNGGCVSLSNGGA